MFSPDVPKQILLRHFPHVLREGNHDMDDHQGFIPVLHTIVRRTEEISPATRVAEVVDIFRRNKSLMAIPVVSEGRYSGVISRKDLFFKWLGNKYALDLFGNKPISLLLEENELEMEPDLDVNSALKRLLSRDPKLEADCFPVNRDGTCLGIVSVSDLMMEMSKTQSLLLSNLSAMSERIRDEVAQARKIQQELLPSSSFSCGGITVDAGIATSTEVGGDFFDYFTAGTDVLGIVIADVSGHGVQAGMVTTAAKASLHSLTTRGVTTPGELLTGINRALIATTGHTLLMTCCIVIFDVHNNRMVIANAGHNFPYRYGREAGTLERLEVLSGFPLGLDADSEYTEYTVDFNSEDVLVLYTDGLIECRNRNGEDFGYERFEEIVVAHADLPASVLRSILQDRLTEFRDGQALEDDVTLMIATRLKSSV